MLHTQIDESLLSEAMDRLREMMRDVVRQQVRKILSERWLKERSVILHTEAPRYFDHRVSESRIREYIRGKDLPAGTDLPLPAERKGRMYFIEVEKLSKWQIGKCELEDLAEWQRQRLNESEMKT